MFDAETEDGRGEASVSIKDLDGTLTGAAGAVVTKRGVYFADQDAKCSDKGGWNMQVCEGRFVKVSIKVMRKVKKDEHFYLLRIKSKLINDSRKMYSMGRQHCYEGFVICFLKVPRSCLGSCSTAQRPVELSENRLQNLLNKLPPQTVCVTVIGI